MRRTALIAPVILILGALLSGCGSQFNGAANTGGGAGPTPPAGSPTITSLSPSTAVAGGPSFTVTVTGTNFASTDTVEWNFTPLSSTYISPTEMQAQVPASLIATPGGVSVIVATVPPQTMNFGGSFTIEVPPLSGNTEFTLTTVQIEANDMVWDPVSQQIYLSVPSSNGTNGNSITALNPSSGQLGVSQPAGSSPDRLAVSSDGSYLYAGIDGSGSVQRFTLPNLGSDINIPLGSYLANEPYYPMDVEVAPGSPHTIAVIRGVTGISPNELGGVAIYDDAVPRADVVPGFSPGPGPIDLITWNSDATDLYGIDTEDSPDGNIYVMPVNAAGVQLATPDFFQIMTGFLGLHFDATTGYLYCDNGTAINPLTGVIVGTYPTNAIQGGISVTGAMVPDGELNIAYFLVQTQDEGGTSQWALEAFDLTHFTFLGAAEIPNVIGTPVKLIRWGSNGLAFLTGYGGGHGPFQGSGVYLITGDFVISPAAQ
jgi:IPT/TIG domain